MGYSISQTIRVLGLVGKSPITVLVDSGSTHNFVQDHIAKFVGHQIHPAQDFNVLVGNSDEIACSSVCHIVPIQLGTHQFKVDLLVLPLGRAELVLGVQWLKTLGPVLIDYDTLTMKFIKDDKLVQLDGQAWRNATEGFFSQFKCMVSTDVISNLSTSN